MALPPERFLHIKASIFPILPEENPNNYEDFVFGKSVCLFLQKHLPAYGFSVEHFDCEDWGWWLAVEHPIKRIEMGVYRFSIEDTAEFAIRFDFRKAEFFSLKRVKKVSRLSEMEKLEAAIIDLMSKTDGVEFISVSTEFPL